MKKIAIVIIAALLMPALLSAQEVSEKKEISVFSLYYADGLMTDNEGMNVDNGIQKVFTNMGRFTVIGTEFRMEAGNVNQFIQQIREIKAANAEIPREVQLGREIFTEADFRALSGSFLVVVPSVLQWETKLEEEVYQTKLKVSVNIIDVDAGSSLKIIELNLSSTGETASEAKMNAIESIYGSLEYQIRKMPVFQIKTGVLDVSWGTVELELGRNMGIMVGDEYVLKEQGVSRSGYEYSNDVGLVLIKDVQQDFSRATVLYGRPAVGDQLQELPRAGVDVGIYGNMLTRMGASGKDLVLGLRFTPSRGFYAVRPVLGVELPLINIGGGLDFLFVPFQAYGGAEYNIYLGRLTITPMVAAAYGGLYPLWSPLADAIKEVNDGQEFINSHFGGRAQLGLTFLLGKSTRLYVEGGGTGMIGLFSAAGTALDSMTQDNADSSTGFQSYLNSYYGYYVGGGITFKL